MARLDYPEPIAKLVAGLKMLPGIGPKSAERMAIWMLAAGSESAAEIATQIVEAQGGVASCDQCGFFIAVNTACPLCSNSERDAAVLCVVEQATDILPIERTGAFGGLYHSLGGRLSPLDNVGPSDLRISPLITRAASGEVSEIILALGSDVEGEATSNYLVGLLGGREGVRVTKLAQGMPAGGGLENADELTLLRALDGRRGT